MAFNKSRKQCVVKDGGSWKAVTNSDVGKTVFDKKTRQKIGTLVEPNVNHNMLRLRLTDGTTVTLKP
jgi:hypothetical protein